MPPEPTPQGHLAALGAALPPVAEAAGAGVDDVLDLLPVAGDRDTQRMLDAYLDQVADLLREVQVCADDLSATIRVVGRSRGKAPASPEPRADRPQPAGPR